MAGGSQVDQHGDESFVKAHIHTYTRTHLPLHKHTTDTDTDLDRPSHVFLLVARGEEEEEV